MVEMPNFRHVRSFAIVERQVWDMARSDFDPLESLAPRRRMSASQRYRLAAIAWFQ